MKEAVIICGSRTAVGKAFKGSLKNTRPDEMAAACLKDILSKAPIDPNDIDDVILGCAMPQAEQGMNLGRIALLKAGFPVAVPGMTINRFCSSGLQAIAIACERIMVDAADVILAGGVESMSMVNFLNARMYPNPELFQASPNTYLNMGLTGENVARQYKLSREEIDEFSLNSHLKAAAAIAKGNFKDEIVTLEVIQRRPGKNGSIDVKTSAFDTDEGVRADSSMAGLGKLRPVFSSRGVCTAGNASQVSDGAAVLMVTSREYAEAHNLEILARFRGFQVAGVAPEIMGIGPSAAVPKLLDRTGAKMADIKVIELNEAFAAQSLAVIRDLGLDTSIVNPNGEAIALGHPLGCTGAKLTLTALHEAKRQGGGHALVTMFIGGGMGAAGLFEV